MMHKLRLYAVYEQGDLIDSLIREPYDLEDKQLSFSMTKSITGLLMGIAVDLGLCSLQDTLDRYYDTNLKEVTIHDMLCMAIGIKDNDYLELISSEDWLTDYLRQTLTFTPGTYFRYSTHTSMMLGRIIEKASGMTLQNFAKTYLFIPCPLMIMSGKRLMVMLPVAWDCI